MRIPAPAFAAVVAAALLFGCGGSDTTTAPVVTTTAPPITCPPVVSGETSAEITADRAALLLGRTVADAEQCAALLGWGYRVGMVDDESYPLTADYVPSRVTVSVRDGVIVDVVVG